MHLVWALNAPCMLHWFDDDFELKQNVDGGYIAP